MHLPQHTLCTRKMELALEVKFPLDFHWVTRPWWRTLTNGSDVKYVFPRCLSRPSCSCVRLVEYAAAFFTPSSLRGRHFEKLRQLYLLVGHDESNRTSEYETNWATKEYTNEQRHKVYGNTFSLLFFAMSLPRLGFLQLPIMLRYTMLFCHESSSAKLP